jgi:hypothetical protein
MLGMTRIAKREPVNNGGMGWIYSALLRRRTSGKGKNVIPKERSN